MFNTLFLEHTTSLKSVTIIINEHMTVRGLE